MKVSEEKDGRWSLVQLDLDGEDVSEKRSSKSRPSKLPPRPDSSRHLSPKKKKASYTHKQGNEEGDVDIDSGEEEERNKRSNQNHRSEINIKSKRGRD